MFFWTMAAFDGNFLERAAATALHWADQAGPAEKTKAENKAAAVPIRKGKYTIDKDWSVKVNC